MKNPYDILVRPLITERALAQQLLNKYTFEVAISANKKEIKTAVEKAFGVKVLDVNTTTKKGVKVVRFGRRPGKKADVKKAVITLAPGQALEYT
jgi:large subunit ribosomal protein L23